MDLKSSGTRHNNLPPSLYIKPIKYEFKELKFAYCSCGMKGLIDDDIRLEYIKVDEKYTDESGYEYSMFDIAYICPKCKNVFKMT